MRQRLKLNRGGYPTAFHRVGFHKFHSCRSVEKQIPDQNGGTDGTACFGFFCNVSGFQVEAHTAESIGCSCQQIDAADRSDGCQSFTPEAHGFNGGKILRAAQLGGCMAQKGCLGILRCHTAAIVGDTQKGHTTVFDLNGDLGSTGIHGIFQKLLYRRSRSFYYFTGSD